MPEFVNTKNKKNNKYNKQKKRTAAGGNPPPKGNSQLRGNFQSRGNSISRGNSPPRKRKAIKKKQKKSSGKQNHIIYYAMFAFIFFIIFWVLSVTVLFNNQSIIINGESVYTDEDILNMAEIPKGVNLIRFDTKNCEDNILDKLVYIDSVNVKRKFPTTLIINVEGAKKVMNIISSDGNYLLVSGRGRILEKSRNPDDIISILGYEPITEEVGGFLESVSTRKTELVYTIIDMLETVSLEHIKLIDMTDYLNIILNYDNRIDLVLGPTNDLKQKLQGAKAVLENEIGENEKGILRLTNPTEIRFLPDTINDIINPIQNIVNSDGIDDINEDDDAIILE